MSYLKLNNTAAPSTPVSGKVEVFSNTSKQVSQIDDTGKITLLMNQPTQVNGWYDVTMYGVSPSNTAAANVTALTALIGASGTAPSGATIYFPGGTYQFNAGVTVGAKAYSFVGQGNNLTGGYTIINLITATSGFLTLTSGNWYTTFCNINFTAGTTQTSGAMVTCNNNVGINFYECNFAADGGTMFNCIDYTGANAGNSSLISNCTFSGFTNFGINVNGAGASLVVQSCIITGQWGTTVQCAAAGINIVSAGALQLVSSDIIGSVNNLLLAPTVGLVIASVYVTSVYFDNALGSCLKITGAGATVRCKFLGCSFTTSNAGTGFSAVEISTTVAAGAQGIEFEKCSVINTFGTTGTTNGFVITGGADVTIDGCIISAWTNGINVTPLTPAGTTRMTILNNSIGNAAGYAGNTTGILLNAGAVAYGLVQIDGNSFNSNTTNISDASTLGAGTSATGVKAIINNVGGVVSPRMGNFAATAIPLTTVTNVDSNGGLFIPANPRASAIRIYVYATNTATIQTLTATVRLGTNNSNADTAILTQAFSTGTAVAGSGSFIFDVELVASGTQYAAIKFFNGNNTVTGIAANTSLFAGLSTAAAVVTTSNTWLGVYFSSATAAAITVRAVRYEILSQ